MKPLRSHLPDEAVFEMGRSCPAETASEMGVEHLPLMSQELKHVTTVSPVPPWWPHGTGDSTEVTSLYGGTLQLSVRSSFPGSGCSKSHT